MDVIPWPAFSAAAGGWALLGLMLFGLITGRWIVSKREADAHLARAEAAEARAEKLAEQNAALVSWAELGKSTFTALRRAAEEQGA